MEKERIVSRNFVLCTVAGFLFTIVFFMYFTGMSSYAVDRLGTDETVAGLVASSFILGDLAGRLLLGGRMQEIGLRRISVICMSASVAVSLLYFVTDSVAGVCAVRIAHGFAYGISSSAINTLVAVSVPASRRGEGLGYYMLSYSLASAVGPFLCMFLQQHGSYEDIFAVGTAVSVVSVAVIAMLGEYRTPRAERRGRPSLSDYFERSAFAMSSVAFLFFFSYAGVLTFMSPYGEEAGLSAYASVFFIAEAVATVLCRLFLGKLYDSRGENVALLPFFAMYAVGMFMLGTLVSGPAMLVSAFLIGTMVAMLSAVAQAVIVRRAPRERYGVAVSTYNIAVDASYVVGPVVSGWLVEMYGYTGNFTIMAGLAAVSIVYYLAVHGIPVHLHPEMRDRR